MDSCYFNGKMLFQRVDQCKDNFSPLLGLHTAFLVDGLRQQHLCQKYMNSQISRNKYWTVCLKSFFLNKVTSKALQKSCLLKILSQSYHFEHASCEILMKIISKWIAFSCPPLHLTLIQNISVRIPKLATVLRAPLYQSLEKKSAKGNCV